MHIYHTNVKKVASGLCPHNTNTDILLQLLMLFQLLLLLLLLRFDMT